MKKTPFLFLLTLSTLISCGSNNEVALNIICPTGIPSLSFFDQGENENFVTTSNPGEVMPSAFANSGQNSYDAIVFDGISGLTNITKNNRNYVLAKWISGGTFYVVSTKHKKEETFDAESTINGFVKNGVASLTFLKLAKENWNWGDYSNSNKITFSSSVAEVKNTLVANHTSFDYYVVAEPVLTAAKSALKEKNIELNVIYDIQEEWASHYNNGIVPAAGLFINKSSYENKKEKIDELLNKVEERINQAINNPNEVVKKLNEYEDLDQHNDCQYRFGFTPNLVKALQANGQNKFNLVNNEKAGDTKKVANSFRVSLGMEAFPDSAFLN